MSENTASLQLYVTYFNRPADVGGLQYWEDQMATKGILAGHSAEQLRDIVRIRR